MIKYIKQEAITLYLSISYFTRLYIPFIKINDYSKITLAIKYLPVVGALVGIQNYLFYNLCFFLFNDRLLSVALMVLFNIYVTRAFHEDGLADTFDAFGGGYDKEKILKILKDSSIGTFGALALIFSVLMRIILYYKIYSYLGIIIIFVPFISRLYPLLTVKFYKYVESDNISKTNFDKSIVNFTLLFFYFFLTFAILVYLSYELAIIPLILLVIWFLLSHYFNKKIDGYRGDCLGAIQQLSEISFLIIYYIMRK